MIPHVLIDCTKCIEWIPGQPSALLIAKLIYLSVPQMPSSALPIPSQGPLMASSVSPIDEDKKEKSLGQSGSFYYRSCSVWMTVSGR